PATLSRGADLTGSETPDPNSGPPTSGSNSFVSLTVMSAGGTWPVPVISACGKVTPPVLCEAAAGGEGRGCPGGSGFALDEKLPWLCSMVQQFVVIRCSSDVSIARQLPGCYSPWSLLLTSLQTPLEALGERIPTHPLRRPRF